ncbi:hypothetical protein QJQ45_010261 [Haematococcus lacustris]|nr:hypothetical protein QJQ45_010261 [Haematococcus lacustris]
MAMFLQSGVRLSRLWPCSRKRTWPCTGPGPRMLRPSSTSAVSDHHSAWPNTLTPTQLHDTSAAEAEWRAAMQARKATSLQAGAMPATAPAAPTSDQLLTQLRKSMGNLTGAANSFMVPVVSEYRRGFSRTGLASANALMEQLGHKASPVNPAAGLWGSSSPGPSPTRPPSSASTPGPAAQPQDKQYTVRPHACVPYKAGSILMPPSAATPAPSPRPPGLHSAPAAAPGAARQAGLGSARWGGPLARPASAIPQPQLVPVVPGAAGMLPPAPLPQRLCRPPNASPITHTLTPSHNREGAQGGMPSGQAASRAAGLGRSSSPAASLQHAGPDLPRVEQMHQEASAEAQAAGRNQAGHGAGAAARAPLPPPQQQEGVQAAVGAVAERRGAGGLWQQPAGPVVRLAAPDSSKDPQGQQDVGPAAGAGHVPSPLGIAAAAAAGHLSPFPGPGTPTVTIGPQDPSHTLHTFSLTALSLPQPPSNHPAAAALPAHRPPQPPLAPVPHPPLPQSSSTPQPPKPRPARPSTHAPGRLPPVPEEEQLGVLQGGGAGRSLQENGPPLAAPQQAVREGRVSGSFDQGSRDVGLGDKREEGPTHNPSGLRRSLLKAATQRPATSSSTSSSAAWSSAALALWGPPTPHHPWASHTPSHTPSHTQHNTEQQLQGSSTLAASTPSAQAERPRQQQHSSSRKAGSAAQAPSPALGPQGGPGSAQVVPLDNSSARGRAAGGPAQRPYAAAPSQSVTGVGAASEASGPAPFRLRPDLLPPPSREATPELWAKIMAHSKRVKKEEDLQSIDIVHHAGSPYESAPATPFSWLTYSEGGPSSRGSGGRPGFDSAAGASSDTTAALYKDLLRTVRGQHGGVKATGRDGKSSHTTSPYGRQATAMVLNVDSVLDSTPEVLDMEMAGMSLAELGRLRQLVDERD